MDDTLPPSLPHSMLPPLGALLAAASIALLAYASHASEGGAQERLQSAGVLALVHGVAVVALASAAQRRLARIALWVLLGGVLLFSGSLASSVLAQWPTTFAPLGGGLLIGGWLMWAADAVRR